MELRSITILVQNDYFVNRFNQSSRRMNRSFCVCEIQFNPTSGWHCRWMKTTTQLYRKRPMILLPHTIFIRKLFTKGPQISCRKTFLKTAFPQPCLKNCATLAYPGGHAPQFLEYGINLCFERRYPKQKTVARLRSKFLPPQKIWAGYATARPYTFVQLSRTFAHVSKFCVTHFFKNFKNSSNLHLKTNFTCSQGWKTFDSQQKQMKNQIRCWLIFCNR